MELNLLPKTSYLRTVLSDAEGKPMYKVETSKGITLSRTTTISKFLPEIDDFKELAKITWQWTSPSKLQFRGKEVDLDTYVPGDEHTYRQRYRSFTAIDGRSYRWILMKDKWSLGVPFLELETNDEASTPIASFHKADDKNKKNARLEIFPPGEDIVDDIIVTYVFVEKVRQERTGEAGHGPGAPYMIF